MAKKELFRYLFLGWYRKRSGQILIVYGDAHASLRSLNRACDALRKGVLLMVFPEGGRSATGELQSFMGGAFFVAIRAQMPVVPMAIVGTYELLPINSFHVMPGNVELVIGEPIPTTGLRLRDMEKLSAQVRQAIADLYGFCIPAASDSPKPARKNGRTRCSGRKRESHEMKPRIAIPVPNAKRPLYVMAALPQYERAVRKAGKGGATRDRGQLQFGGDRASRQGVRWRAAARQSRRRRSGKVWRSQASGDSAFR